ncbi:MAG TPA: M20/M25/M40 family metallo-hydrolase [Byssovorax sp.]
MLGVRALAALASIGACVALVACEPSAPPPALSSPPRPPPFVAPRPAPLEQLTASLASDGSAMTYERALVDEVGVRMTGTAAFDRAVTWAKAKFAALGHDASEESFRIDQTWERGAARGKLVGPDRPIQVRTAAWTPATPRPVTADVVRVVDLSPAGIDAAKTKLRGRAVLLDPATAFAGEFLEFNARLADAFPALARAGVAAVLWPSRLPNDQIKAHCPMQHVGMIAPLPIFDVAASDAAEILARAERGRARLELVSENRVGPARDVANVAWELRGRERPDEIVLVTAHLDSWDLSVGAQDNGTGVAMVLASARAIAALGAPPRRSIRFVLFGGEEQGLRGSRAYVEAHAAELDRFVAVLNTDDGSGAPRGWQAEGRPDVEAALAPIAARWLTGLGGGRVSRESSGNSDHTPFFAAGVPALNLWVDGSRYPEIHHLPTDTIDRVDAGNLAKDAAIVGVTAYAVADAEERLAKRLDEGGTRALLERERLLAPMRALGFVR